jgi:hypothetical protein
MRLARCDKGHYYDKDKFKECPHCNGMQIAPGETVAFEDPNKPKEEPKVEAPKVEVEERVAFSVDEAKSESNYDKESFVEEVEVIEIVEDEQTVQEAELESGKPLDEMTTIVIEEDKPNKAPKKEEPKAEPVKEEPKPEPVKEEVKPEPVKEEPKAEPVKEEPKPAEPTEVINIVAAEPVKEEPKAAEPTSLRDELDSATTQAEDSVDSEDKNSNPIVGYLICIEGMHKGKSFDVKEGRNFIGRSMAMDISLSGNSKIQRERHAIVTFDPRSKTCFFQPEESRDILYINDEPVFGPSKINHEDIIFMADEKFIFFKLTCDKIDWL